MVASVDEAIDTTSRPPRDDNLAGLDDGQPPLQPEGEAEAQLGDEIDADEEIDAEDEADTQEDDGEDADADLTDVEARQRWAQRPVAAVAKTKSRKTRKQELESLLEEELVDAEPLPTLFSGGVKQQELSSGEHYVAGPEPDEEKKTIKQSLRPKKGHQRLVGTWVNRL